MRQESNHRMSNPEGGNLKISNSRAMGVIILIALLFVFQVVTFVVHKVKIGKQEEAARVDIPIAAGSFNFNPNTIGADSLQLLGFSPKQAQSILNYRNKGGKFRVKRDFAKLYVVDSAKYAALVPYILLPDSIPAGNVQKKSNSCTKLPVGKRNVQEMGDSCTNLSAEKRNVQEMEDSCTNLHVGKRNVQEMGDSCTNLSAEKRNVQEMEDSCTNLHVGTRNVQKMGDSCTNLSAGKANVYGGKVERNRYVCNLNRADSAQLVQLYGIGGYFAKKILQYRERLGGSFADKRQLLEIEGFGQERYEKIEGSVVVLREDIKGFSLLDAGKEALEKHPYIGPYAARGILTYIKLKGKEYFKDNLQLLQELVKEHIITENNALRIREYLLHL